MLVASTAPNNTAEPNPSFTQQVAVAQTSSTATTNGENIKVFGRIRPENSVKNIGYSNTSKRQTFQYTLDKPSETDDSNKDPQLHITLFKDETQGLVNNSRERFDFSFTKVFDQHTTQEEVFDNVAKGVVDSVLDGYNGTLFAYGQTGSGKTYTITGGMERYEDRGLIPRTIQYIFKRIREQQSNDGKVYSISISYMEIYNECGYDLLDAKRDYGNVEDIPKIIIQEDLGDHLHFRNLSSTLVQTEEEAFNLLFMGDTNKMIAETPSNPSSSRSHCIFTIQLSSRDPGDERVRKSKLNLVDLAGSERAARTKINGQTLKEAKHINLSLHYLEQVIIALHEQSLNQRTHIPFRNSLMTLVLRDSLGGNCKTTMIATMSMEQRCVDETISTCRFAQRVALIKNNAVINEELDLRLVVEMLRRQVEQLKAELALARQALNCGESGDYNGEPLPAYEKDRVRSAVLQYLAPGSGASGQDLLIFSDVRKIYEAFRVFKELHLTKGGSSSNNESNTNSVVQKKKKQVLYEVDNESEESEQVRQLRKIIEQRDQEISVLASMLQKSKQSNTFTSNTFTSTNTDTVAPSANTVAPSTTHSNTAVITAKEPNNTNTNTNEKHNSNSAKRIAYERFKQTYKPLAAIQQQKETLKQKYSYAKSLGQDANTLKSQLTLLKSSFEKRQMQRAIILNTNLTTTTSGTEEISSNNVTSSNSDTEVIDGQLREMKREMEEKRNEYKEIMKRLKETKQEVDHLQRCLEQARIRMQKDFEDWFITCDELGDDVREEEEREQESEEEANEEEPVSNSHSVAYIPSVLPETKAITTTFNKPTVPSTSNTNNTSTTHNTSTHNSSSSSDTDKVRELLKKTGIKSLKIEKDLLAFYEAKRKVSQL